MLNKALKEILQAEYHFNLWSIKYGNEINIEQINKIKNLFIEIITKIYKLEIEIDKTDNKACLDCSMKHILKFSIYNNYEKYIDNDKIILLIKLIFDLSKENII